MDVVTRARSTDAAYLAPADILRVLVSLIRTEQERLQREGRLGSEHHIDALSGPLGCHDAGEQTVDEEGLGFDSLARLDLVMVVNRFFDLASTGIEDYLLVQRRLSDWVKLIGHHLELVGDDAQIVFSTSGSTGSQSHIRHNIASLISEVSAHIDGPLAHGAPVTRVLCPLPTHHIYGFLWGILLPARMSVCVVDLPSGLPSPVMRTARKGDLILSTPFGWSRLDDAGARFPEGVRGISSGGPTTSQTWESAQRLGLSCLTEVYGSSETAGLGWRKDPAQPLALFSDIRHNAGSLYRDGALQSPLEVQDNLDWVSASEFTVAGRRDRVVQVGGVNVSLDFVRAHLRDCPDVNDVAVRLDGDRLKAFVIGNGAQTSLLEVRLRDHMNSLPAPARPDRYTFGSNLPRTETGKLRDW